MTTPRKAAYIEFLKFNTGDKVAATTGSVIYFNGEQIELLAPGSAGSVLTSNGAGLAPTWGAGTTTVYTVTTANNLPVTLATFSTTVNTTTSLVINIVGKCIGGALGTIPDTLCLQMNVAGKNAAGVLTTNSTSIVQLQDQAAWSVNAVASGTDILIQVTGGVLTNINWYALITSFSI